VTDPTGQLLLTQRYDPFGGLQQVNGFAASAYGFAGEEQDDKTGQVHLRARTYNPATGRFLQQDPVLGTPAQPRTLHNYAYAFNNPVNFVDPSGQQPPMPGGANTAPVAPTQSGATASAPANSYSSPAPTHQQQNDVTQPRSANAPRSANQRAKEHQPTSNPNARELSQGFRPRQCSGGANIIDLLWGIHDVAQYAIDWVGEYGRAIREDIPQLMIQATPLDMVRYAINPASFYADLFFGKPVLTYNDSGFSLSYTQLKTAQMTEQALNFAWENRDLIISLIPIVGDIYDFASGLAGQTLLGGHEIKGGWRWAFIIGGAVGAFSYADEIMSLAAHAARYADDIADTVRAARGLSHLDEVGDLARAGRQFDKLVDLRKAGGLMDEATATRLRHLDELTGGSRAARESEALLGSDQGGPLLRRMQEARLRQRLGSLDEMTGGNRALKQGDEVGPLNRRLDPCKNSFTAGTMVQTDQGEKPIEEVQVGDKVLAEDPETGEQDYFEVVALTNHPTDEVLQITIESDEETDDNEDAQLNTASSPDEEDQETSGQTDQPTIMEITPDHPVYVEGKGWLLAENLEVGDRLRRVDGGVAKVLAIERVKLDEPQLVYNFTVKGPHTYFVLDVGVLVHNTKCLDTEVIEDYLRKRRVFLGEDFSEENIRQAAELVAKYEIDEGLLAKFIQAKHGKITRADNCIGCVGDWLSKNIPQGYSRRGLTRGAPLLTGDKTSKFLKDNLFPAKRLEDLEPSDVIDWFGLWKDSDEIGDIYAIGTSHIGIYVGGEGQLVFSKLGINGPYLLLPFEHINKIYATVPGEIIYPRFWKLSNEALGPLSRRIGSGKLWSSQLTVEDVVSNLRSLVIGRPPVKGRFPEYSWQVEEFRPHGNKRLTAEWVDIDKIKNMHPPNEMQPGTKILKADYLAARIRNEKFDLTYAIPVFRVEDGTFVLRGGHHRTEALRRLGYKQVPVVYM
jgi:RHS repeat-associated protein